MTPGPRRISAAAKLRSLLVFAEGEVTESVYLTHWRRKHRFSVAVRIERFHGVPLSLVKKAVEAKKESEREARRGGGDAYDEVWCVFDVDDHPDLGAALVLARENGVEVAVSNPCIELWFLLHYQEQTANLHRHAAQKALEAHTGARGKAPATKTLEEMDGHYDDARERARRLEEKHRGDATPAPGNPSSGLWQLIDSIRSG